jgi:serine/threonine-protein kinase
MEYTRCPACGAVAAAESRFCAQCGANLGISAMVTAPPDGEVRLQPDSGYPAESGLHHGRFPVGIVLGERYRILGLLGRGGMGEVYRAHDLKLEQQVALKFLPESAAFNPSLMERFRSEVRIARQISHRNVCRVYDLGDVNGAPFISMEYVDGEDLASLLRRIGRLPGDKALEFARRFCAGLAAAHEKGVLHRDLKPGNIMIDGRGQLLIMDFGLAAVADAITGHDIRSGTPAYMSPEQKDGRDVTVRSDIYALGIVLAEMFSGSRPTPDGTLSTTTKDVDPTIEKVIQRCVDPNPAKRFASALDVARALPGGDPLAEALAAGETPSPQMVAASDDTGILSVRAATLCLIVIAAGLIGAVLLGDRANPLRRTPFRQSPEVMAAKARELAERLGYTNVADSAYGLFTVAGLDDYARENLPPEQSETFIRNARTSPVRFWYRQSPRNLDTLDEASGVTNVDPPPIVSGMVNLNFDAEGRLTYFAAVPPQAIGTSPARAADWTLLFDAADLDESQWTQAGPTWLPLAGFDERAAWNGPFPHAPAVPMHADAAAWKGQIVQFELRGPWAVPTRDTPGTLEPGVQGARIVQDILLWSATIAALLLAASHYRRGRGDGAGALRLAAFSFVCGFVGWLLTTHHVGALRETWRIAAGVGSALTTAAFFWILYVAVEPLVRRRWPQSLISWTRLLGGAVKDPVVAGHVLVGMAVGLVIHMALGLDGLPSPDPSLALGAHRAVAALAGFSGGETTGVALAFFFLFFLVRTLLRRTWAAVGATVLVFALFGFLRGGLDQVLIPAAGLAAAVVLTRFGLLSLAVMLFVGASVQATPMTTDLTDWYASSMLTVLGILAMMTLWCFHHALGGRRLLKADLLDA